MSTVLELLAGWRLERIVGLAEVAAGATNLVYRVECSDRALFLRIYKRPDRAMALREHALIHHVRAHGVAAPLPIVALSGDTVVRHAERLAALYEAAPGAQLEPDAMNASHARSAGLTLARIHLATARLPDVGYAPMGFEWDGAAWVERLNAVERAILARDDRNVTDQWALRRLAAQRAWLREPQCLHSAVPQFAPQVVHGDYHHANLFFEGHEVSAVIDWEQATFLPRAYEVVRACFFMFRMAPDLTRAFVEAYRTLAPMKRNELDDGAMTWGCYADHHVWALEEVYLHGNDRARRFIPHAPFVPFAEAWGAVGDG